MVISKPIISKSHKHASYPAFIKTRADQELYDMARAGRWEEWVRGPADLKAIAKDCYFDIDKAEHAKEFIEQFLFVAPDTPFVLYPWQWKHIIGPIFGWMRSDGLRRFNFAWIEIPKKNGKACHIETPLPTPTGWTTMGEVQIGDFLLDEGGRPTKVVAATEVMNNRTCYEMVFSDGEKIIVDAQHEWLTQVGDNQPQIRTTEEIKDSLLIPGKLAYNHSIELPWLGLYRFVIAVNPVPSVPVRCVQVDSPSHLYLAGRGMIPTHNSILASAISLYMLVADGEYSPEVYNAACSRAQARVVFDQSAKMVKCSPQINEALEVVESTKRIIFRPNSGFIHALSKEAESSEGLNASCVVADEVHVWKGRKLFDSLKYAGSARQQPLIFVITTAGDDTTSFAYDLHQQAEQIIDGQWEDESQYAYIASAPIDSDWRDPEIHKLANPSFGLCLDEDRFEKDFQQALRFPSQEASFRRYRLNQWVKTEEKSWLSMDEWDACKPRLSIAQLKGKSCNAGLDLSSVSDLTSLVLVFPADPTAEVEGGFHVLPFFWCPLDTAYQREQRGQAPYHTWIKQGHIIGTPGNAVDFDLIRQKINELADIYGIDSLALDRQWQGQQLQTDLLQDGLNVVPFGQGFASMSLPSKRFEILVKQGLFRHGNNPVLRWNAQNCIITTDPAGNIKPDKARASEKIDGVVASIMAVGRSMSSDSRPSIYLKRGLRYV